MFANKKTILFITKSKIKIVNVTLGGRPKEEIIAILDWTPDTLPGVLSKFQKNIKHSARILLSEDFVYTVTLDVPSTSYLRDDIKRKAQELIPENLDETIWDFKEVGSPTKIQVVAVAGALFATVSQSITKVGLHVEAIESLSFALARFSQKEQKPMVFVYIDDGDVLVTLAQKGVVLGTEHLAELNLNAITQFIIFAKERFDIEVKDVIFCGNTSGIDLKSYENEILEGRIKAQIQNISPIISLAKKEDLKGKDEEVLNLGVLKPSSFWQAPLSGARPESLPHPHPNPLPKGEGAQERARLLDRRGKAATSIPSRWTGRRTGILVAVFVVIAVVVGGFLFYQNQQKPDQTKLRLTQTKSKLPESSIAPSQTRLMPTATPSAEADFSSYTIRVLNGSGRAGEAGRLEAILKDNGFNVIEIGNAQRSDYEKTEIHHKEKVPESIILSLDKILNSLYDFSIDTDLEENAKTDILIIIGSVIK